MTEPAKERDYVSVGDLSNDEIRSLFAIADRMLRLLRESHGQLAGHILGSLFFEASTRTRLSFEAAMNRLGGRVLTLTDANASSLSKGESFEDSIRMVSSYTDVIVLRHPRAGAARLAAEVSPVPVINAGDGGHEHPTQTLCDLYALRRMKGRLADLRVILYGDLKYGRTTHSLAMALARFGSDVLCIAEPGLELPRHVAEDCAEAGGAAVRRVEIAGLEGVLGGGRSGLLIHRDPAAWELRGDRVDLARLELDALYVTRLQRERLAEEERGMRAALPNVDVAFLAAQPFREAVVLHPLPRIDEIHPDVDRDPRGVYFRQAAWGVPVRMALLSYLLGKETDLAPEGAVRPDEPARADEACRNPGCILADPLTRSSGLVWRTAAGEKRCSYCDTPVS